MTPADKLSWAALALSWALTLFTVAYNRWNSIYLFVTRIRFWIVNPTTLWTVRVIVRGGSASTSIGDAVAVIRNRWPEAKKQVETTTKQVLRADGLLLEVQSETEHVPAHPDGGALVPLVGSGGVLVFRAVDIRSNYREATRLVDQIGAVVHSLMKAAGSVHADFGATISFPSGNPYLGAMVRRLREDHLKSFHCSFDPGVSPASQSLVVFGPKSIEITCDNAVAWASLSKQFLAVR